MSDIDPDDVPHPAPSPVSEDYSLLVGTTPVSVFPPTVFARAWKRYFFMKIWNTSSTATIWLSRAGAAAVGAAGSYPLAPGEYELFTMPQAIPQNNVSAIATQAGAPLNVELA